VEALDAIESVLVDPKRESLRDVLRHQAGLDDQLSDLVSVVSIADEAPTTPALEVSREAMAQVDEQLARLQACCGPELAALNAALRTSGVEVLAAGA
jgi:CubicO group peptidase (beta-lactamase class C family)